MMENPCVSALPPFKRRLRWNFLPAAPGIISNCSNASLMSTVRLPAIV